MKLLLGFGLLVLLGAAYGQAVCNTCLPNGAKCMSSTQYDICMNGQPLNVQQTCDAGLVCSADAAVCVADATKAVCAAAAGQCDPCATGAIFNCVDRTHFSMCQNPSVYVACDAGKSCYSKLYSALNTVCIDPNILAALNATVPCDSATTPTQQPPVTPSISQAVTICTNAKAATVGPIVSATAKFFFAINPQDATCKSYIYCEIDGATFDAINLVCSTGYYDHAKQTCVTTLVPACNSKP